MAEAVSQQAKRLWASESVMHTEDQADAVLLVFALRAVRQLAHVAGEITEGAAHDRILRDLEAFDGEPPERTHAGDTLAQLGEYLAGAGRRAADLPPLPCFSRRGCADTLRVAEHAFEVDAAEAVAIALATTVLLTDQLDPTTTDFEADATGPEIADDRGALG